MMRLLTVLLAMVVATWTTEATAHCEAERAALMAANAALKQNRPGLACRRQLASGQADDSCRAVSKAESQATRDWLEAEALMELACDEGCARAASRIGGYSEGKERKACAGPRREAPPSEEVRRVYLAEVLRQPLPGRGNACAIRTPRGWRVGERVFEWLKDEQGHQLSDAFRTPCLVPVE